MVYFNIVIPYVLWMLVYILVGYGTTKLGWTETAHARSISGLLVYIFAPAMFFNAFQRLTYNPADFRRIALFFVVTLAIQVIVIGLLCLLLHKRFADARYRFLSFAMFSWQMSSMLQPWTVHSSAIIQHTSPISLRSST